ncbi:2-hydroxyacid dehydrogenase [Cognatilysobacter bugurensis]|nr:glyoxylate/hydroxypyruvate reductase A [Lysobacter bugurensis]
MDVLVCTSKDQTAWRDALAARLPAARVHAGPDAPPCDYAVLWKPPGDLFAHQPRLKAMFSLGAGVNGLLAMQELPRDVPLVRMEGAGMGPQMVEYALHAALRELRGFGGYADAQAAACWNPGHARARRDLTVGVLGLGVLGGAVACALADFGFDVVGWSRTPRTLEGVDCLHGNDGLDAVLGRSRLLVMCLPLTPDTDTLLDATRLARLPAGAAIVNIARGELIDDAALLTALDAGHIGAAYLDVFRDEPLPPSHPYWRHPRVIVTPHIAALTDVHAACDQVADKIRCLEAGLPISGVVERDRGY